MLSNIRRSTKSGWTYLLVGLLIVVFAVFFGVPGDACGGSGAQRALVAEVQGTDIHTDDVNAVYNRVYGGQRRVDDSQLQQQQAQALRSVLLINLLSNKAQDLGLRVSDEELADYLKDPLRNFEYRNWYGRQGGFDGGTYKAYVQNQLRISLNDYEQWKRRELLAQKYLNLVEMQFQATGWEIQELHELRNTKVNLEFVKFDPSALGEFVPVSDEDVQAFVAAEADAIQKTYEERKEQYEVPAEYRLRRIFIVKPEESAGEEAVKEAIKTWDTVQEKLDAGDAFADIAGEFSESEKETQGLMEWTTADNIDQNIGSKLPGMKVGDVETIETNYAFMKVKLEEKKEAKKTALAEVQDDLGRELLQQQKVEALIREMIAELQDVMTKDKSLDDAVSELKNATQEGEDGEEAPTDAEGEEAPTSRWHGVTVDKTGDFSLEGQDIPAMFGGMSARTPWDRVPKIGKNADLARDAFKTLSPETPTVQAPYKSNGQYFFVRLLERTEATDEQLEEQEPMLLAEVRGGKIQSLLGPYAALFAVPMNDYGPFLEGMLDKAIENGTVKLYERNYEAIKLVQDEKEEDSAPAEPTKIDLTQRPDKQG